MRARHFSPLPARRISPTVRGGDEEPRAGDSPPPAAAEIAFCDRPEKKGFAIVPTECGEPREDELERE
ncbi:hypothetical protein [Streptomyces goshikiensis]|uniref:hypothetical protein n=1 Tax=Streptomyces goshikiensis TaxID=1942 RepID=UPI00367BD484